MASVMRSRSCLPAFLSINSSNLSRLTKRKSFHDAESLPSHVLDNIGHTSGDAFTKRLLNSSTTRAQGRQKNLERLRRMEN